MGSDDMCSMILFVDDRHVNYEHKYYNPQAHHFQRPGVIVPEPLEEVGARDGALRVKHTRVF